MVKIDGEPLRKKIKPVYIMLNKPKGITCTTDTKDKTNVISYINHKERIFPIGRLDKLSEGLIFLTNDGDIVNKILRAGNDHEKEYIVQTHENITPQFIKDMREGVKIGQEKTLPCFVKQEGDKRFRIILKQGLNRQIRRMCEALGNKVFSLKRVRIMEYSVKGIAPGTWRYFTAQELVTLNQLVSKSSNSSGNGELGE